MKSYVGLLLVGVLLAGCGSPQKPGEVTDVKIVSSRADTINQACDVTTALEVLSKALHGEVYSRSREWLFSSVLNILLRDGHVAEARERYLEVLARDSALARAGFGIVYRYYLKEKDTEALVEWTKKLVDAPLPEDLSREAFAWHMQACFGNGQFDRVLELTPVCVKKFDGATSRKILGSLINSVFAGENYNDAARLLDVIEKESGDIIDLQRLITVSRTDWLVLQERWQEAEQQFMEAASSLPDSDLGGCLNRLAASAVQKGQLDMVDRLCDFVLRSQQEKGGTMQKAATQWLTVANKRLDTAGIPSRLNSLVQFDIPPKVLLSMYQNQFYFVMVEGTRDHLTAMMKFGDRLASFLEDEYNKAQIKILALDGAFTTEDYARALEILGEGIADREEEWHEMAINKVKAHLALQKGEKKEAVKRFRKFMDYVSTWERPEQDPSTGIIHTREMCLGHNAKRIGDILASMGDAKASREAYEEAKNYYEKALDELKSDSKEYELARTEMAEIPVQNNP